MSPRLLSFFGCALLVVGCAHSSERAPVAANEAPAPEREVVTYDVPPEPRPEPPPSRPRLSRTVTLGQDSDAVSYTTARPPAPSPPPGPNVVVNNNVVVNPPVYYGGYGGYGYGYGPRGFRDGFGGPPRTSSPPPQWGSSGWEGARRTAAPGQTPGVGGNWPTVPSYGPAPMR